MSGSVFHLKGNQQKPSSLNNPALNYISFVLTGQNNGQNELHKNKILEY